MPLYDNHTHTHFSHDSQQQPEELAAAAKAAGLAGIAITDHCDSCSALAAGLAEQLAASAAAARRLAAQHAGQLDVLCGVEIGEELWAPEGAAAVRAAADYDVILASNHCFYRGGELFSYSLEPFDAAHYTSTGLAIFFRQYLEELGQIAADTDYDVLTHLDCPLRYINGKYNRQLDITPMMGAIEEILRTVIRRGKTLEVNTSGMAGAWNTRMPGDDIIRRYRALGGRQVCIASDAHASAGVAAGFAGTVRFLQALGYTGQTVYRKRQAEFVAW